MLVVVVRGASSADGPVLLSVRHRRLGMDYWLPGDGQAADGRFTATARLDVRSAALGERLASGRWTLWVGVHGGTGWSPRVPVPRTALPGALLDGTLVAVPSDVANLVLDVDARTTAFVPTLSPGAVTITESVRGTLMEAVLPDVPSTGTDRVLGIVRLDRFALPGHLVARDGRTVLECYLSGVAGTATISTRFGRVAAPCGLDVTIDGVGQMSVAATPAGALSKRPGGAARAAAGSAAGALRTIRRAVPAPLEPAVRRVRENDTARRLYRKLSGRR